MCDCLNLCHIYCVNVVILFRDLGQFYIYTGAASVAKGITVIFYLW